MKLENFSQPELWVEAIQDALHSMVTEINSTTFSGGKSICYSKANNRLYIGGTVNGTGDFGSDFGTNDTFAAATGFILEVPTDGSFFTSRRFPASTHQTREIVCQADGSYSFSTYQVATTLDYRTTYDGISDIKSGNNLGSALTRIASGNSYKFTKIFAPSASSLQPVGYDSDPDGNMVIGFQGSGTTADIRTGVDGIADTKTSAGSMDTYVVKVSSTGAYVWGKRIGGTLGDNIYAVQIRPSDGNVFVLGTFGSGGAGIQSLFRDIGSSISLVRESNNLSPFLAELAKDTGTFVRTIPIASSASAMLLNTMKFDSEENLYLGGDFRGDSTFRYSSQGYSITKSYTYGNSNQAVLAKLRP